MANKLAKVILTLDGTKVEVGIDKIRSKMSELANKMHELALEGKQDTKEFKEKHKAYDKLKKAGEDIVEVTKRINTYMKDLGNVATTDLRRAYREGIQLREGFKGTDEQLKKLNADLAAMKAQIDKNTDAEKKFGSTHNSVWQSAVRNITAYVGVFGAFNAIKSGIQEIIRGSAELSDHMANIRKVSGLAMRDIEELTRRLTKLDTRTTLTELERIAYSGAKLGFGEYGISGLEEFTKAANQVNVALKEDLGEEALTALSKITENMGLIKKMGVEDAMLATSSAMFKLAATSTAAAGPIVEVTKRLVPVAQAAGFAADEILAISSAADSLQLMPEVVGTAMSKFIMAMQKNHNLIEKTLEIPEKTISQMIKAGEPMEALMLILDKMSGKNMTELDAIWKLLGSDGQRLMTVIMAMANHTDRLTTHLETSRKAFIEATAVTDEYNIQQETAQALFERSQNLWRNAFINPDSTAQVKDMARAWYDFTKGVLDSSTAMNSMHMTLNLLLTSFRILINLLPMITIGLLVKGVTALAISMAGAKNATDGFTMSWKKMDAATKSNWISLAIGLFVQFAFWIKEAVSASDQLSESQKQLDKAVASAGQKADEEINTLSRLKRQVDDTSLAQEERGKILNKIKTDYDHYLDYLGIEIKTVDDLAKHYTALTKVMRQRYAYQEREDYKRQTLQDVKMDRRTAGADITRIGNDLGAKVNLSEVERYARTKTPGMITDMLLAGLDHGKISGTKKGQMKDAVGKYVSNYLRELSETQRIDAAFKDEIGDFDYDKYLRSQVKGEFINRPDKQEIREQRKAEQLAKKSARDALDQAQKDSTAIISKVEEFYKMQASVIEQMVASGEKTRTEADMLLKQNERNKNVALALARGSIAGNKADQSAFRTYRDQTMPTQQLDQSPYAKEQLKAIQKLDVEKAAAILQRFNGSQAAYGLSSGAFTDKINKGKAQNNLNVAKIDASLQQEVEKVLLQYQYVENAQRMLADNLTKLNLMTESWSELQKRLKEDAELQLVNSVGNVTVTGTRRYNKVQQLGTDFINQDSRKYTVDLKDSNEMANWLSSLTAGKEWTSAFPQLQTWVDDSEKHLPEIQQFYLKLIQYEDNYYEAVKKRADREQKIFSERWERSGRGIAFSDADRELGMMQRSKQLTGDERGTHFGSMTGITTLEDDPEIAASLLRMEQARQELELMRQISKDKQLIREKEAAYDEAQMAMQEQLMQAINDRIGKLKEWTAPLEEFAEQIGEAAGTAIADSKSMSEQVQAALKNMIQAYGESTIKIVAELMTQRLKKKMLGRAMAKDTKDIQEQETDITVEGGKKRMDATSIVETGIASISQTMGQKILTAKKAQDAQEMSATGAKTQGDVMAGIAGGAAKIIGSLGFWGIPLIAVITALLTGLLQMALSALFGGSSESSSSTSTTTNAKLVSGMLTYDKGNVQRFIGQDGKVYTATEEPAPRDGLVSHPIATTVQGQPALVAENGPEIVIGRETTRQIMMNEPGLIRYLADYERLHQAGSYRPFDSGNVREVAEQSPVTSPSSMSADDARALTNALQMFVAQCQRPISANVNMYGNNGLYSKMKQADKVMSRYEK